MCFFCKYYACKRNRSKHLFLLILEWNEYNAMTKLYSQICYFYENTLHFIRFQPIMILSTLFMMTTLVMSTPTQKKRRTMSFMGNTQSDYQMGELRWVWIVQGKPNGGSYTDTRNIKCLMLVIILSLFQVVSYTADDDGYHPTVEYKSKGESHYLNYHKSHPHHLDQNDPI